MERSSTWRPINPEEPADERPPASPPGAPDKQVDGLRLLLATLVGAVVLAAAGVILWAGTPQPAVVLDPSGTDPGALTELPMPGSGQTASSVPAAPDLLVDVQGAVVRPGLHRLEPGSRVGDAIAVAGGYGPGLDIRVASEQLNLAEKLADGAKIYVPARGDPTPHALAPVGAPTAPGDSADSGAGGGLIDVNTAGQVLLETLPGIGPVTAGKIIAAREEEPFALIDDLLARKVVGPATFEKIRQLISVAP